MSGTGYDALRHASARAGGSRRARRASCGPANRRRSQPAHRPRREPAPPRGLAHRRGSGALPRLLGAPPPVLPLHHGAPHGVAHRAAGGLLRRAADHVSPGRGGGRPDLAARSATVGGRRCLGGHRPPLPSPVRRDLDGTRPDVPALVAHLASLLALVRWRADRRPGWLWAAGACQGAALALSIKAIFALAGVAAVVVGLPGRGESLVAAPRRWRGFWAVWRSCRCSCGRTRSVHGHRDPRGPLPRRGARLTAIRRFREDLAVPRERGGGVPGRGPGAVARAPRPGPRHPGHPVHGALLWPALTGVSALFLPRTPPSTSMPGCRCSRWPPSMRG